MAEGGRPAGAVLERVTGDEAARADSRAALGDRLGQSAGPPGENGGIPADRAAARQDALAAAEAELSRPAAAGGGEAGRGLGKKTADFVRGLFGRGGRQATPDETLTALAQAPAVVPARDAAADRLAAGAAEKAASFYEASAPPEPAADATGPDNKTADQLQEGLQTDEAQAPPPAPEAVTLSGNGGVDLTGVQTKVEAAELVVEQKPPPPGAFAEMAENIAAASAQPSLNIPVRPDAPPAAGEPAPPAADQSPSVSPAGEAEQPPAPQTAVLLAEGAPSAEAEIEKRLKAALEKQQPEHPSGLVTEQGRPIASTIVGQPPEQPTGPMTAEQAAARLEKITPPTVSPDELVIPPSGPGLRERVVHEPRAEQQDAPAPGVENVPVEKRPFLRKVWHAVQAAGTSWAKNLNPRGKDVAWKVGVGVGVAETALVAGLEWGPLATWAKAGINLAVTHGIFTLANRQYLREEFQARENLSGKELTKRIAELQEKHQKATGKMRSFFGGVAAGATYTSVFGITQAVGFEIAKAVGEHLPPVPPMEELAKGIPKPPEGLPEYWGETSPPAEAPAAAPPAAEAPVPEVAAPPAEAAAPAEVPAGEAAQEAAPQAGAEAAANTVADNVKEVLAQDPSTFTETAINQGTSVSNMLNEAGYNLTWTGADADLLGAHIAANYDMLTESWQNMVDYGVIPEQPFPVELPELSDLVERAKEDEEVRKKLVEALHWIRAGDKIKILSQSGITQVLSALK